MQGKKETEIEKTFPDDSPLRKLIKMFRTNTVVKHHFQGGGSGKPVGVAKSFFKNALSFNSSVIPGYTAYDRFARYSDYCEMLSYAMLNKGLQIYADEATQKDEDGKIIKVTSEDKETEDTLQDLFDNVLQLNGKKIYKIVRDVCKYGDYFVLIDITTDHGVVNLIHMPANEVEREEGYDKNEPTAVRFKWNSRNLVQEIPNAFVAHFRLDGDDLFYPYGQSVLEAARRPWRQLVLLEDSMMVYRITRSAERRAFYLDVMGVPSESIPEVVNKFNEELKKKKVVNEEGKIDLRYGATLDMTEDYILPVRGQDSATRIETIPGGQNIGDIEDIEFIQKNLFSALGIPKAFLTYDEGIGSKQVLTTEDIRFARTIAKIQECIINELVKISLIHLYIKGKRGRDLINFKVKMTNPSTVAEMQKNELWRSRMDLVQAAGQGVFDTTFIYKNFLRLSDDAIDMIRKGQIQDKIFQAKLMALENSGGQLPGGMGGGLGGMGGGMDMGLGGAGGFGGGMGGGMPPLDMGGGDMGGAPPNVMGTPMPEAFNPAAEVLDNGSDGGLKDLSRISSNERVKTTRGQPETEITTKADVEGSVETALDTDSMRRDITSPMGQKESSAAQGLVILENYRTHTKNYKSIVEKDWDSYYYNSVNASSVIDNTIIEFLEARLTSIKSSKELLKEVKNEEEVDSQELLEFLFGTKLQNMQDNVSRVLSESIDYDDED